ncbi:MAG: hypothetical protein CVU56_11655 [Deltaproteobacteria bacterium HGW-Deltaproteobacteria-14]|nr:MAG: hypothetical protein CVU56_11655 [Deltaproteobacteria bacterium HGW-Deltaproteobacteria-14]
MLSTAAVAEPSAPRPTRERRGARPAVTRLTVALLTLGVALSVPAVASARPTGVPRIEVAFVLDATGSMSPWIEQARRRITAIATDLATGEPAPEVRFGLVAYRDTSDDFVTRVDDLTPNLDSIKAQLDATHAQGGGDYPEAVLEALEAGVVQLRWTLDDPDVIKLIYLVGDAPPNHHPDTPDEDRVLAEALDRGIVIHTIACGNISDGGEGFFERVARMSEGRPFRLRDAGPPEARSPEAVAVTAVGATRTTSLAAAVSGSARAYSGSVGVAYAAKPRPTVATAPLAVPPAAAAGASGLLGPHVRVVRDARAWSDLWLAFTSTRAGEPPAVPEVDFERTWVLAIGGGDAGLELARVEQDEGVRFAVVRPTATPGVRFLTVPAGDPIVAAADSTGGAK